MEINLQEKVPEEWKQFFKFFVEDSLLRFENQRRDDRVNKNGKWISGGEKVRRCVPEMNIEDADSDTNGERDEDHGEKEILAQEGNSQWRRRNDFRQ